MEKFLKNQQIPLTQVIDPNTGQAYYSTQNVVYQDKNNTGVTYLKNVIVDQAISSSYFSGSITNAVSASYALTASYLLGSIASASYALSASYAANGGVTQITAGSGISISPSTGLGNVTINSSAATYNTATGSYGSFYDTGSVLATSATTVYSMSHSTTDISNGVFVSASGGDRTRIKFTNAGVYNIQFSSQFSNTDNANQDVVVWVRKNGTDVPDSSGVVGIPPFKAGSNGQVIASWNYYLNLSADDYIQLCWHVEQANVITLETIPAGVGPTHPRTPSLILTAQRVDTFLSNTGSFSGSFIGAFTGSFSGSGTITSASYAATASYVNPLNQTVIVTGSLIVSGSSTFTNIGPAIFSGSITQNASTASFGGVVGIGTTTPLASLDIRGIQTATGSIARTMLISSSLSASANSDVLVGLDINPTFNNGAFTGVTNFGLRSSINYAGEYNGILIRNTNSTAGVGVSRFALGNDTNTLLCGLNAFNSVYGAYLNNASVLSTFPTSDLILGTNFSVASGGTSSIRFFTGGYTAGQQRMQIFSTGNIGINTTTDAGYRLDVNGTARVQGALDLITGARIINTGGASSKLTIRNNSAAGWGGFIFQNGVSSLTSGNELLTISTTSNGFRNPLYIGSSFDGNTHNPNVNTSAQLDVDSTTKGFLPPRMTLAQRIAISTPASGLIVFETGSASTEGIWVNETTGWQQLLTNTGSQSISGSLTVTNVTASSIRANGSITVGNITDIPSTENSLNVYPPPAGGTGEGGQMLLAASGGLYSSASMIDTWQDQFRILRGSNTGGSTAGLVYVDLQSGNTQFVGAVTASAYSGLPNDYLYATRSGSSQTVGSAWANTDIIFNNVSVSKGISFNTGTGIASLTGGKVYRVTARLAWGAAATYNLQFSCYTSANVQIGPIVEIIQSTNGTNNISDGTLEFIYAPGSNTDIKIRCTNNNTALSGETVRADLNTQFIIQQIA
jgi:hypothetical protein